MTIHILSVGGSLPAWVHDSFAQYAKRIQAPWNLKQQEITAGKRLKSKDINKILTQECAKL